MPQKTIAHHLSDLRLDLKDSGSDWSDAELTRCLEKAVADLTRFLPNRGRMEVTIDKSVTDESFTTPTASSATYYENALDISASSDGDAATLDNIRPDMPRPVLITVVDADTSITQLHIIVKGVDVDNQYIEEHFWLTDGLVQTGVKYFALVTEVEIDEIAGNGAGDTLSVGTGAAAGVWVQLDNPWVKPGSCTFSSLTLDTDWEMDYSGGRVSMKSDGDAVVNTAYTISYIIDRIRIDISSITDGLIKIDKVFYPEAATPPENLHRFDVFGDTLILMGSKETQYEATDKEHATIQYKTAHSMPTANTPGTWPTFLDPTVQLAASAYALFMMALKVEHQVATDLASVRTELGLTTAVHTLITNALTDVIKYLDTNSGADATGMLGSILTQVAELRTKVIVAWDAAATELGLVKSVDIDQATEGADALLDTARGTVDGLNDGGPTVPEKYATLAATRAAVAQARIGQATGYLQEAQSRLSDIRNYVETAGGYTRVAEAFIAEAATRLRQIQAYLEEAEQYQRAVANGLELVDRWKAEGIERRNEAWAIWRDHPQYAPNYQLSNRYQTGGATTAS